MEDMNLPDKGKEASEEKQAENENTDLQAPADLEATDPPQKDGRPVKQAAKEKLEKDFKEKACGKLRGELEKADDKQFADPVIGYLLKRCGEDNGLAQDVMQEHKAWEKCLQYIFDQARKQAKGNRAAVRDDVVYEWAEDYYHLDDKALEEKKAREAAERKKKEAERKKQAAEKAAKHSPDKAVTDPAGKEEAVPKPKPKKNELEGQMDIFSLMGM